MSGGFREAAATSHARAPAAIIALVLLAGCSHLVLLHDPLTAPEHNDLGVAYESHHELDRAAAEYRAALRLQKHFSRARVNLGNVEAARGRWPQAEHCFRTALADSSDDADALNNLAVALLRQGRRTSEARVLARHAVAIGGARDSIYRATLAEALAASP